MKFNINHRELVALTNKLEKLHRSALPSAIRGTLGDGAFNVKTETMPASAKSAFEERSPNFFKANSRFENATGFVINNMVARVGFVDTGLRDKPNYAVEELEQQEEGGTIPKRSFIALKGARVGNNFSKAVRPNARLKQIRRIVNASRAQGTSDKQKFMKSVAFAGKGGLVLSSYKGRSTLWRVNSLRRAELGRLKLTPLYSFKQGRSVKVEATHFMRSASFQTADKLNGFYIKQAMRQLNKIWK